MMSNKDAVNAFATVISRLLAILFYQRSFRFIANNRNFALFISILHLKMGKWDSS